MKLADRYLLEHVFLAVVLLLSITGFWNLYFGEGAAPGPHQHLHLVTNFLWLFLLACQLRLVARQDFRNHRQLGMAVLVLAPLLFASAALLSVHSAHKGLASGRGDAMIVQNVMTTLELGVLIVLAFVFRKRRKLHGAFLLATALLFMGIALFFTLIGLVPGFRIEGPETFHRFESAAIAGQVTCLAVGLVFVVKDYRNGWPLLLAGTFFVVNDGIGGLLAKHALVQPLTEFVGSQSQGLVFAGSLGLLLALLAATGIRPARA